MPAEVCHLICCRIPSSEHLNTALLSGTVDWTVHEVIDRGGQTLLAEAVWAVGEVLGSTLLDAAFMTHLKGEVGEEVRGDHARDHLN